MEPTTIPGSRFLLLEKGRESEQISSLCLRRGFSLSWLQGQEFCEGKHCPSQSSLSAVSSSWHDKIPQQRDWGCVIQKCPVVWVEKRGKHQMLLFKQRPSFMLNTTKITWFSVLRIKKKRGKKKNPPKNLCTFEVRASYVKWILTRFCQYLSAPAFHIADNKHLGKWQASTREIWRQGPEFAVSRSDKGSEDFRNEGVTRDENMLSAHVLRCRFFLNKKYIKQTLGG